MINFSRKRNKAGFTLIEIFLTVAILGVLMAIAIPNFIAMKANVQKDMCINNLRQLKLAKEQWVLENNKLDSDTPTAAELDPYIKGGTTALICPLDAGKAFSTSYTINNIATDPACKILPAGHKL